MYVQTVGFAERLKLMKRCLLCHWIQIWWIQIEARCKITYNILPDEYAFDIVINYNVLKNGMEWKARVKLEMYSLPGLLKPNNRRESETKKNNVFLVFLLVEKDDLFYFCISCVHIARIGNSTHDFFLSLLFSALLFVIYIL